MSKVFRGFLPFHAIIAAALVSVMSMGIAGCSTVKAIIPEGKVDKELFKSRDQFVRIVKQDAAKGVKVPPNEHPVILEVEQIRSALASMEVMLDKQDKSSPVFSTAQLDTIAPHISRGLAAAGPNEDIAFAVIDSFKAVHGLAKEQKYTAARVFYRDGKLNIIFGNIQGFYQHNQDRRIAPLAPGSRTVPAKQTWVFIDQPDQAYYSGPDGRRSDWITLDLAAMEAKAAAADVAVKKAAEASGATEGRFYQPKKSVEERLTTLNDLKEKKLISEEEYQKKRAAILSEL